MHTKIQHTSALLANQKVKVKCQGVCSGAGRGGGGWALLELTDTLQWNPSLLTPVYNGQFRLNRRKVHIVSLELARLMRTRITDNFPCPESQSLLYRQPRCTVTSYLHTVYFHCHNYVLIVDIVPCLDDEKQ